MYGVYWCIESRKARPFFLLARKNMSYMLHNLYVLLVPMILKLKKDEYLDPVDLDLSLFFCN